MKFRELDKKLKQLGFIPLKYQQTSHRKYTSGNFTITVAYKHEYPEYYLKLILKTQKQRYQKYIEKEGD